MKDKYVVTGGAGFIGSHISRELIRLGHPVTIIDNFSTGKRENITDLKGHAEVIEGDIRDFDLMKAACDGARFVLHQAALGSVPRSIANPLQSNDHNVKGTLTVLLAARDAGVERIICASSGSVYGTTSVPVKSEDLPPNPLSPYAVTKFAAERYTQLFAKLYNMDTVALRYFNVFGPYQDPTSQYAAVIPKFITMMQRGEQPTIHGDGTQSRDFTYVANVVSANLLAATAKGISGEIMNVACGGNISVNTLVKKINTYLGTDITPIYGDPRPGDVPHSQADISKITKTTGYTVRYDFDSGLQQTIDWYTTKNKSKA